MAKPVMCCAFVKSPNKKNIKLTPSNPREATDNPMTSPPRKATINARVWPSERAASAVRTLACVAATIPKYPVSIEQIAPAKNATAVR